MTKRKAKEKYIYSNGYLKYDGDFVNDKAEEQGTYNFENGNYYIGQFSNNNKHGEGIVYSYYGNVIYEGSFVDDAPSGYCLIF